MLPVRSFRIRSLTFASSRAIMWERVRVSDGSTDDGDDQERESGAAW